MKANDTDNYVGSQRELADGVLKQAAHDLRRFHGAVSAVERDLYLDAYTWVMSDDFTWPFSFLNVCCLLNLSPEDVRQAAGPLSAKLLKNGTLKTYKGYPHGMPTTQADVINADLLAFIKG
jgi:hypothetical protein